MKRIVRMSLIVLAIIALAACAGQEDELQPDVIDDGNANQQPGEDNHMDVDDIEEDRLRDLIRDQYGELELTVAVSDYEEVLPGSTIPIIITIANNGDEKISYTVGSGSFEVPRALILNIPDLQPVLPKSHLGAVTMDLMYKELPPGDQVQYTLFVRVIEPNDNFVNYSHQLWLEGEEYIAYVEWPALLEKFPGLKAAQPGDYEGYIYFLYALGDVESHIMLGETGYTRVNFRISVAHSQ